MVYIAENSRSSTAKIATPTPAALPSAPEKTLRLDWIPMGSPRLRPPAYLSAQERGWWTNLFWAMFDAEPQGYLAVTSDLWTIAGARDPQRWQSQCARVMASFDVSAIAGQHAISFPPMVESLEEQRRKLLAKRGRGGIAKSKKGSAHSLSLSDFDVEGQSQNQRERETRAKKGAAPHGEIRRATALDRLISG